MAHKHDGRPDLADCGLRAIKERPRATSLCLKWLSSRPLSESQLRGKLKAVGVGATEQDQAIDEMIRHRYLDDVELAGAVARDAARRGKGPLWLRQALKKRGLAAAHLKASNAVDIEDGGASLHNQALGRAVAQFRRRHPSAIDKRDIKAQSRAVRFFAARGFDSRQTRSAMRALEQDRSGDDPSPQAEVLASRTPG